MNTVTASNLHPNAALSALYSPGRADGMKRKAAEPEVLLTRREGCCGFFHFSSFSDGHAGHGKRAKPRSSEHPHFQAFFPPRVHGPVQEQFTLSIHPRRAQGLTCGDARVEGRPQTQEKLFRNGSLMCGFSRRISKVSRVISPWKLAEKSVAGFLLPHESAPQPAHPGEKRGEEIQREARSRAEQTKLSKPQREKGARIRLRRMGMASFSRISDTHVFRPEQRWGGGWRGTCCNAGFVNACPFDCVCAVVSSTCQRLLLLSHNLRLDYKRLPQRNKRRRRERRLEARDREDHGKCDGVTVPSGSLCAALGPGAWRAKAREPPAIVIIQQRLQPELVSGRRVEVEGEQGGWGGGGGTRRQQAGSR
ncbi:hypothetical protein FQA47_024525 [Oryzias melastigma]|uniref:Uncharacterized protein n=1 Tax=Oryzias melastigma TaxID=30732 RepID=A0A834FKI7_ORYME|nr:hypothetical protein FQA47_024525 [Oryzias melastigma]